MAEATVVPKRRRMRQADRLEQLLGVAESLFVEHGYSAVTMEDIARAAGVTRPVVYNHFQTREGAYLAVLRRAREGYDQLILANFRPEDTPEKILARGADIFFRMLEEEPGRWKLLFGSTAVLPNANANELSALRFETIHAIATVLQQVAPHADAQRVMAAAHSISGVGERLGLWWLSAPELSREELVEHYTAILWAGLRPLIETGR